MKIAFQIAGGYTWQAGISHPRVFLCALRRTYGNDVTLCLLTPGTQCSIPKDLSQDVDEVVPIPTLRRWTIPWGIDRALKRAFSQDFIGTRILKRHKIDVLFGMCMGYRYDDIPTLSWVPDFQHLHMPEMFSLRERLKRDRAFLRAAKLSSRIVLMSDAVKRDFEAFAPKYAHKARVLQTASYIPEAVYETDPKWVIDLYHLPEKFVYLPNQFWKHKNHELVFRALELLKDRGIKAFIVCSGHVVDDRHPEYFSELLQKVHQWGIQNHVAFLGLIPRDKGRRGLGGAGPEEIVLRYPTLSLEQARATILYYLRRTPLSTR